MEDQVREELEWLRLELEMARRAIRQALKCLHPKGEDGAYDFQQGKAQAVLTTALERPFSIEDYKARRAGISPKEPP